jgi:hypothetical protein
MSKEYTRGILVKKDGLYYRDWDDGEQLEKKIESFIPYLKEEIRVEEDVTFEDFFNYIMDEYKLITVIFASQLGHFDLGKWKNEWAKPFVDKPDGHTKTKYLEVAWVTEWWDKDLDREIEEWVAFGGKGETLMEDTGLWEDDMNISFSFCSLNEMKNYPFKINTEYKMFDWEAYRNNPNARKRDKWYAVDGSKRMTVFDVIGGILDDISFYGDPDHRNKKSQELQDQCEETDKIIKEKGIDKAVEDGDLFEWDPDFLEDNEKDE